MALNLGKYQRQKSNRRPEFKVEKGEEAVIRILTFTHKVAKGDVERGLYAKAELGKSVEEFAMKVERMFGVDKSKRPVFVTPDLLQLYRDIQDEDEDKAKIIRPQTRYFMNIVDMEKPEKKVELYACPASVFTTILKHVGDKDYGEKILGITGHDIRIANTGSKDPKLYYSVVVRPNKGEKLGSELQKQCLDVCSLEFYNSLAIAWDGNPPAFNVGTSKNGKKKAK